MALEKISDKQKEILEFIKSEILNRGYRHLCVISAMVYF